MRLSVILYLIIASFGLQAQSLEFFQQKAAENNPALLAKYKSFEAAMDRISQQKSLPDPNLSLGYFISPVETRVGPQVARLSLNQMFPWFGTLSATEDVFRLKAEATYQQFLDAKHQLFLEVAKAYYPLYELDHWVKLEKENIQILETYKDLVSAKYQNGEVSMVDLLRLNLKINEAETALSILEQKQRPLLIKLEQLSKEAIDSALTFQDSVEMKIPERLSMEFDSHPAARSYQLLADAEEQSATLIQKRSLPKIGLGLDYVIVAERTDMMVPDNGKDIFMPMVSMSLPIFRKKYKAAEKESEHMQVQYKLEKQNQQDQFAAAYDDVLFLLQEQKSMFSLYEQQIIESKDMLDLLYTSYSNEGGDIEDLLEIQQTIIGFKKKQISAQKNYMIAWARMQYLNTTIN